MDPPVMRLLAPLLIAAAAWTVPSSRAEPLADEGVRQAIHTVIQSQLAAFATDNAPAAFAATTPAVRQSTYGGADRFLELVRQVYPMLYHHARADFLQVELKGSEAFQLVRVTDEAGRVWHALFILERQPDGSWRIGACSVNEMSWKPT